MRAIRRAPIDAEEIVSAIRTTQVFGHQELDRCLRNARVLRDLGFSTDPAMADELRSRIRAFVIQECSLTAAVPSEAKLDETSLSFVRSNMPAVAVVLTIAEMFARLNDALPHVLKTDGEWNIATGRSTTPRRPKNEEAASAMKRAKTAAIKQVTVATPLPIVEPLPEVQLQSPTSELPLPDQSGAQVDVSQADQAIAAIAIDESNRPQSASVASEEAPRHIERERAIVRPQRPSPALIVRAAPDENGIMQVERNGDSYTLVDFDPQHCADHWESHEGAVVDRNDILSFYRGKGVRRIDLPEASGKILRLNEGYLWQYCPRDGLWRDETVMERRERALKEETKYFRAFDDPTASPTHNVLPISVRGCVGPGQDLNALRDLARALLKSNPYTCFEFAPGKPIEPPRLSSSDFTVGKILKLAERDFEDGLIKVPLDLQVTRPYRRLYARLDSECTWKSAPSIPHEMCPEGAEGPEFSCLDDENDAPANDPPYARAARIIKRWADVPRAHKGWYTGGPSDEYMKPILQGSSYVFSGPAGSGKTYEAFSVASRLAGRLNTDLNVRLFFLNFRKGSPELLEKRMPVNIALPQFSFHALSDISSITSLAAQRVQSGINILFVDEYSEVSAEQLAKFAPFHQVLLFGDYGQDGGRYQPVFDFMRRCGGGSHILSKVWRALSSQLYDVTSLLGYDGLYRAVVGPQSVMSPYATPSMIKSLFCPDDAQAEVIAMWCAAQVSIRKCRVTVVIDGAEAEAVAKALGDNCGITFLSSSELRGHECDVLLFSAGAFDRSGLSTTEILERLILLFGRARQQIEIVLPESDVVGSALRRCTCLLQPLLSYRIAPPEMRESDYHSLAEALSIHGFKLGIVDDLLIVVGPLKPCLIVVTERRSDSALPLQNGWETSHFVIDLEVLAMSESQLVTDRRFVAFVRHLERLNSSTS